MHLFRHQPKRIRHRVGVAEGKTVPECSCTSIFLPFTVCSRSWCCTGHKTVLQNSRTANACHNLESNSTANSANGDYFLDTLKKKKTVKSGVHLNL